MPDALPRTPKNNIFSSLQENDFESDGEEGADGEFDEDENLEEGINNKPLNTMHGSKNSSSSSQGVEAPSAPEEFTISSKELDSNQFGYMKKTAAGGGNIQQQQQQQQRKGVTAPGAKSPSGLEQERIKKYGKESINLSHYTQSSIRFVVVKMIIDIGDDGA